MLRGMEWHELLVPFLPRMLLSAGFATIGPDYPVNEDTPIGAAFHW